MYKYTVIFDIDYYHIANVQSNLLFVDAFLFPFLSLKALFLHCSIQHRLALGQLVSIAHLMCKQGRLGIVCMTPQLHRSAKAKSQSLDLMHHPSIHALAMTHLSVLGQERGTFFMDPFKRYGDKYAGSWGESGRQRSGLLGVLPVSYIAMNLNPTVGKQPTLMSFHEVAELFSMVGGRKTPQNHSIRITKDWYHTYSCITDLILS